MEGLRIDNSTKDYSNGAYHWHGTDFAKPTEGSTAYEDYYLAGFKFTKSSHDIWKLGNHEKKGQNTVFPINSSTGKREKKTLLWSYTYESTAVYGKTTFMKPTEEFKRAQQNDIENFKY